jgi:hypothetical protein
MATAKQLAWRKKFARLYGKKRSSKKAKKTRSPKIRRVKVTARRRRASRPRYHGRRTKKGVSISLMSLAHAAVQYSNLTGQELGTTITALINSIMNGDDSFLDIVLNTVNNAIANVTANPIQVAVKGAIIALVFTELKKAVGSRKLIGVGKFSIRV